MLKTKIRMLTLSIMVGALFGFTSLSQPSLAMENDDDNIQPNIKVKKTFKDAEIKIKKCKNYIELFFPDVIKIISAHYGTEKRPENYYDSYPYLSRFDGKVSGSMIVTNSELGGDPQSKFPKKLSVSYYCMRGNKESQINEVSAEENKELIITCEDNKKFNNKKPNFNKLLKEYLFDHNNFDEVEIKEEGNGAKVSVYDTIQIAEAKYGTKGYMWPYWKDVSPFLSHFDGKTSETILVSNSNLGGDPVWATKTLNVSYYCKRGSKKSKIMDIEQEENKELIITCKNNAKTNF